MPSLRTGADPATQRAELGLVPGLPGSGRRRYAAAMWLHLNADLPGHVLEVYRALAMDDGADPLREIERIGVVARPRPLRG